MKQPDARVSAEATNYIGYGSLTPRVAEVLLDRTVEPNPVLVERFQIGILRPDQMSSLEEEIMFGGSRYVLRRAESNREGIAAWCFSLRPGELVFLTDFDITDLTQGTYIQRRINVKGQSDFVSGLIVVRSWLAVGTSRIELRDPRNYSPYEPFSDDPARGEVLALEAAAKSRLITLAKINPESK